MLFSSLNLCSFILLMVLVFNLVVLTLVFYHLSFKDHKLHKMCSFYVVKMKLFLISNSNFSLCIMPVTLNILVSDLYNGDMIMKALVIFSNQDILDYLISSAASSNDESFASFLQSVPFVDLGGPVNWSAMICAEHFLEEYPGYLKGFNPPITDTQYAYYTSIEERGEGLKYIRRVANPFGPVYVNPASSLSRFRP